MGERQSGSENEAASKSEYWDSLEEEKPDYHIDYLGGVSHSMLNVFRNSIAEFNQKFILRQSEWKRTKAMDFGSAFHAWMLERDLFDLRAVLQPLCTKQGVKNKETWAEFEAEHKKKAWLSVSDMELLRTMEAAILDDTEARKWMVDLEGINEKMISWQASKEMLGIACKVKCKPDRFLPVGMNQGKMSEDVIVDLKTTGDVSPEAIAKTSATFSYHCQASLYIDGAMAINGGEPCRHISVFINKTPPHEIACVEYTKEALALGREMNVQALKELADCMAFSQFGSRTANKLTSVDLPRWFYSQWAAKNSG